MLDLRVVLAACLAAFVFLLAGIGVFATLRVGRTSSVAVVKDSGLPPEQVTRQSRNPWTPVETPAGQVRAVEEQAPAPEITGAIEQILKTPSPPPPAPAAIEDILNAVPPAPVPPAVVTRAEPIETPMVKENAAAPAGSAKSVAKLKRTPAQIAAARRRHAAKLRARAAQRVQLAPNAATTAPVLPFNPQPIGTAGNPVY